MIHIIPAIIKTAEKVTITNPIVFVKSKLMYDLFIIKRMAPKKIGRAINMMAESRPSEVNDLI